MARMIIQGTRVAVAAFTTSLIMGTGACQAEREMGDTTAIAGAESGRRPASRQLASLTGLSHMPVPANGAAFDASLRRHYPAAMLRAGRGGDVLVDVRLDRTGRVLDVDVVEERRTRSADEHRIVVLDKVPGSDLEVEREVALNYDPAAFGAAAKAAVLESRFRPALRAGKPVPYTLRMTVSFDPAQHRG
jgi:hypothetical protein